MLREAIVKVQDDERIGEIVIVDDASDDGSYQMIVNEYWRDSKFKIYRNPKRLDCYANKHEAIGRARNPWVILFDSDNILTSDYIDAMLAYMPWDSEHWYLPTFGRPDFDYREFAGETIDRSNVAEFVGRSNFLTALNTANHFVHRDAYLAAWDPQTNPGTADSIYMALRWLETGGSLTFVPGMEYEHRIHEGSHFQTFNSLQYEQLKAEVIERLRELR